MAAVHRLVTFADGGGDARSMSISLRHEAELADGRRVLLLDDRGWSESRHGAAPDGPDIWSCTTVEDFENTAPVVGPDEPYGGRSWDDMEAGHLAYLASRLQEHGVEVDAASLRRLPHDVVLSERLRARLGRSTAPPAGERVAP